MNELEDRSTHRKIIRTIDLVWGNGHPFSPREVSLTAGVSKSQTARVLEFLVELDLVKHNAKAFRGRHYTINRTRWIDLESIFRAFEFGKFLAS